MATYNDYYRAGYRAAQKDLGIKADNFTKPETDDDQWVLDNNDNGQEQLNWRLMNRRWQERGLDAQYGFGDNYDDVKDLLQAYDDLPTDGKKVAKEIYNGDGRGEAQFIVILGVNRSLLEIHRKFSMFEVRNSPKGKWQGTMLKSLMDIFEWIYDVKPTYFGTRWPTGSEMLDNVPLDESEFDLD